MNAPPRWQQDRVPRTGSFLGPSKSGKLISLILEQYRGVFEKIHIFSPSVNIDDGWVPVNIEQDLGVNTEKEQAYWEDWDEAALRGIIQRQRDHRDVQEVGDEETVPGADHARRPSGYAAIAQSQRRPGHALPSRPAHANQHLGELPEAHQRSGAGQGSSPKRNSEQRVDETSYLNDMNAPCPNS